MQDKPKYIKNPQTEEDREQNRIYARWYRQQNKERLNAKRREYDKDPKNRAKRKAWMEKKEQEDPGHFSRLSSESRARTGTPVKPQSLEKRRQAERRRRASRTPEQIETDKAKRKAYYQKNREKILAQQAARRDPAKDRKRNREYHQKHKARIHAKMAERYRTDPEYRIKHLLRSRIRKALNGTSKSDTTAALLGCSITDFIAYVESLFTDGMTMDHIMDGSVHIDHIKPCASFDLTDPSQQEACFHFTNLQPMWAEDNWSKGSTVDRQYEHPTASRR